MKKDALTLRRHKGYVAGFLLVPAFIMSIFIFMTSFADKGYYDAPLIYDHLKYTTTLPSDRAWPADITGFFGYPAYRIRQDDSGPNGQNGTQVYFSSLLSCVQDNTADYVLSKMAIISENADVREAARTYFEDYVFDVTQTKLGLSNFAAETFSKQEEVFDVVRSAAFQPYCFAVYFKKFDLVKDEYEIEFSFDRRLVPDTNAEAYYEYKQSPDLEAWDQWFAEGTVQLYPYITEFIARSKGNLSLSDL